MDGPEMSVERVEVGGREATDGGAIAAEYGVAVLGVEVDRRTVGRLDAAAAVLRADLVGAQSGRQVSPMGRVYH